MAGSSAVDWCPYIPPGITARYLSIPNGAMGPEAAIEQLRGALALGAHRAVLLETDGREFGPIATAEALVVSSCLAYLALVRKESWPGLACSSVAQDSICAMPPPKTLYSLGFRRP